MPPYSVAVTRLFGALLALLPPAVVAAQSPDAPSVACVAPAAWSVPDAPGRATPVDATRVLSEAATRRVVLLGEGHDVAEHHRWQLHTIAALHALRPDLVLAFEMFPRSAQPVLDRWVAGKLSEREFLKQVRWDAVWGFDARMYLPLFHFARMHRLPMVAVNVEPGLTREVGEKGFDNVPVARREGVTRPAPPLPDYEAWLRDSFGMHDGAATPDAAAGEARLRRFIEAQQVWDRAMAQGIAEAARSRPGALVVAILGAGHVFNGWGVPHQLRDLGIAAQASLLPWEPDTPCTRLRSGYADAVFGLRERDEAEPSPQRLGIRLDLDAGALTISDVERGSLGERAGLKARDVVVSVAGTAPREASDLIGAVRRQPPGTWLPITVRRGDRMVDLIARFPPLATP
jgi:uncharacterized iron-regulated protein